MDYHMISADCHVDLIWLPPDLFTANAAAALKDRMPYVTDGPKGPVWTTRAGAALGLMNGMGAAGREYVPGQIHLGHLPAPVRRKIVCANAARFYGFRAG